MRSVPLRGSGGSVEDSLSQQQYPHQAVSLVNTGDESKTSTLTDSPLRRSSTDLIATASLTRSLFHFFKLSGGYCVLQDLDAVVTRLHLKAHPQLLHHMN